MLRLPNYTKPRCTNLFPLRSTTARVNSCWTFLFCNVFCCYVFTVPPLPLVGLAYQGPSHRRHCLHTPLALRVVIIFELSNGDWMWHYSLFLISSQDVTWCLSVSPYRERKQPFLLYVALAHMHVPLAPQGVAEGEGVTEGEGVYAATLREMDRLVGAIKATSDLLDKENNLILFTGRCVDKLRRPLIIFIMRCWTVYTPRAAMKWMTWRCQNTPQAALKGIDLSTVRGYSNYFLRVRNVTFF